MLQQETYDFNKLKIQTFHKVFEILMDKEEKFLRQEINAGINEFELRSNKMITNAEQILNFMNLYYGN